MGYCPVLRLFPVLSLCSVLAGQVQPGLPRLLRTQLRTCRSASLVALDPKLSGPLSALVLDDALAEYQLAVLPQDLLKWSPESRAWIQGAAGARSGWVAFDASGTVVAGGVRLPKPVALADLLLKAGVRSPIAILRAFLKSHPDHQEVRAELIGLLHTLACQRTLRTLQLHPKQPRQEVQDVPGTMSRWTGSSPWLPTEKVQLSPQQDLVIWASLAQELENLFKDPAWAAAPIAFHGYFAEAHSPMIQAIYRRHLPRVQEALMARPRTNQLWQTWVRLQGSLSTPPSSAFILGLKPLPETLGGRGDCPPTSVVALLVADARRRQDWAATTDLLMRMFDEDYGTEPPPPPNPLHPLPREWAGVRSNDAAETWKHLAEPLLEALVATGQDSRALQVVQRLRQEPYLSDLDQRLGDLAQRLGRTDLAALWRR